jgi:hypothetical protein
MLGFFKIFSLKNSAKQLAFLTRNKAKLCKKLIITLVYEKNAHRSQEMDDIVKLINQAHNTYIHTSVSVAQKVIEI